MAEAGLQVPDIPAPPALQAQQWQQPAQQAEQMPHLNWSQFKPEFSGKPEEDAEAYLLRTNDWMNTHQFLECIKVQRFCLTVVGEARLWYESLRPINVDWQGLQNQFIQQYSKKVIQENNYFMHGDHFTLMEIQKH